VKIACLDLEGVLIPEIWVAFANKAGIPELARTTRDEPDYGVLMQYRLDIFSKHSFGLDDIQSVIGSMDPLPGAVEFLDSLRSKFELLILSDTFREFAGPLIEKLGYPTLFCHELRTSGNRIDGVRLRLADHKRKTVQYLQKLNFEVVAVGDSYNDLGMLKTADHCMLFNPPEKLILEYPDMAVGHKYHDLLSFIENPNQ